MLYGKYEAIERDIVNKLENKKMVYIESGSINDSIVAYRFDYEDIHDPCGSYKKRIVVFETSNCIFPKEIRLDDFETITTEEFHGNLFVEVY